MGKLKDNQKGFGAVEAVLVLVIVILIGVVGYMVYRNHHKTTTASVATTSSKSTNTASNKTSSSSTTPASSTQYMTISEWGVRLPLSSGITGITYKTRTSGDVQSADITVPNSQCTPMATIYRGSASDTDPTTQGFDGGGSTFQANNDKQLGGYYYSFMTGNASTCFSGEQMVSGTADGVQTEAVYSQLKTAFTNMSATN